MLDPTRDRWKRLAVGGWEMQKIQRQLGQYVVLSLPRESGGGFFSGGLKLGDTLFK
jgi:hypothetical protein